MDQWPVAHILLTDTSEATLIPAPPVTHFIKVHGIFGSNNGGSLTRVLWKDGATTRWGWSAAANGGGFAPVLARPWALTPGTALKVQQTASVNCDVTAQYEIGVVPG